MTILHKADTTKILVFPKHEFDNQILLGGGLTSLFAKHNCDITQYSIAYYTSDTDLDLKVLDYQKSIVFTDSIKSSKIENNGKLTLILPSFSKIALCSERLQPFLGRAIEMCN